MWCPCMAINVSVNYYGGFLTDMMLLTLCCYHRGTRLNATFDAVYIYIKQMDAAAELGRSPVKQRQL